MRFGRVTAGALGVLTILGPTFVHALINPYFTPIHLTEQSEWVVEVELKPSDVKDQYAAVIKEVLKGKMRLKELKLDLSRPINRQHAETLRGLAAASKGKRALFLVGEYLEEGQGGVGGWSPTDPFGGGAPAAPERKGLLHLHGQWAEFQAGGEGGWTLIKMDTRMQSVWAGGTDMLGRCVRYILKDKDPEVPVNAGAAWAEGLEKYGPIAGKINALCALDLNGSGRLSLYVASSSGDRLLAYDPNSKELKDFTASRRLVSRSQAFAWGDFSADGRLDLVSFDGEGFSLHVQQADGGFSQRSLKLDNALCRDCVGLSALGCGRGNYRFLVSTKASPVLVAFDGVGPPETTPLDTGKIELQHFGRPGACLVADFEGDALPDVLQPFAKGSILYLGLGGDKFQPGVAYPVQLGQGEADACLADFDGDGRLDVFCVAEDTSRIWQNEGSGKFSEHLNNSGEIAYISKPGGVDCAVGDVNNDGRQDALIVYQNLGAQIFFNRGFRSFGHAHLLDLAENRLLSQAETGQQAGCLGDFDGDGAQDMVLALKNGEVWIFYRENEYEEAVSATVSLPLAAEGRGPMNVTGWTGKRCLGAWNVIPGTARAFFGLREPGTVTVQWTLPGGKPQEKKILVKDKPVRWEIK